MTNKEAAYILSDKCHEYTVEELHMAFDLAIKALENRPQGEWIYDKSIPNWVCSECGAVPSDWGGTTNNKYTVTKINRFCRLCGADMRVKGR